MKKLKVEVEEEDKKKKNWKLNKKKKPSLWGYTQGQKNDGGMNVRQKIE